MEITRSAVAGTLESCDSAVSVEPRPAGAQPALELVVESSDSRFAGKVRQAALSALAELGVTRARVAIRDRSALDCTVRARVLAACLRASGDAPSDGSGPATPWEALR
ncbi:MAG: citrate lyase acyl carrier protein [Spirochaetes bacterium GWB1_59_5]|nr:MAG: citrate lyase acyl carrier protein [Spirochaetes bacterium GWB1_59_5]